MDSTQSAIFSYKNHQLFEDDLDRFVDAYTAECRQREMNVFGQLMAQVTLCRQRIWVLSLINKQDLWWSNHDDVESHYRRGDYGQIVERVAQKRNPSDFRHEFVFGSLLISNFYTGRNELLSRTIAGYDQRLQTVSLRRFVETLDALKSWEQEK